MKQERADIRILRQFLHLLQGSRIHSILDAGSGKTSLAEIRAAFPEAQVTAAVYPGDQRKLDSIRQAVSETPAVQILEQDICAGGSWGSYDLVIAHLLLGEAAKFGHTSRELLSRLLDISCRYLILIDYLEDPNVDNEEIPLLCQEKGFVLLDGCVDANPDPQVFLNFTGVNNFGVLASKEKLTQGTEE